VDGIFDIEHFGEVNVFVTAEFMGILAEERHQSDRDFHYTGGTNAEV
jgi:hypothetical protein